MKTVTQKIKFRQSLLKYAAKNGATKAAIKYNVSRQYIYRWRKRYDGTLQSLADNKTRNNNSNKIARRSNASYDIEELMKIK